MIGSTTRKRRATVTFWVTPEERRLIRRVLAGLGGERTDALLGALGLRGVPPGTAPAGTVRAERVTTRKSA